MGLVRPEHVVAALERQTALRREGASRCIGDILVEQRHMTPSEVAQVLAAKRKAQDASASS